MLNERVRRPLALLTLAAALVAVPASAAAVERVSMKPRHGDVNTRFVFHGTGWKPNAELAYMHGAFCPLSLACPSIGYVRYFKSDANGEFTETIEPGEAPPQDFVGTDFCFMYAPHGECKARKRVGRAPPSASITPARVTLYEHGNDVTVTALAEHFKAGQRLTIHVRHPDGRHRALKTRARRRGAHVGGANAWAPRGGAIVTFSIRRGDPGGRYDVRVADEHHGEALTSFVVRHQAD